MTYNLTSIQNANTTLDIINSINDSVAGGYFWIFLIVALFIIIYINLSFYHAKETFLVTSFMISMISSLMWIMGVISFYIALITLIMSMIGMILFFLTK